MILTLDVDVPADLSESEMAEFIEAPIRELLRTIGCSLDAFAITSQDDEEVKTTKKTTTKKTTTKKTTTKKTTTKKTTTKKTVMRLSDTLVKGVISPPYFSGDADMPSDARLAEMMNIGTEYLNAYGNGGGIHFCWQDAKGIATARPVTDEHVATWFKTTEKGQHFAKQGYRCVRVNSYAGPIIVPDIKRTGPDKIVMEGKEYTYSGLVETGDREIHYHNFRLDFHLVHDGKDMGMHECKHVSTKSAILFFINNEKELTPRFSAMA